MSADTSLWTRVLRSTLARHSIALVITALALLARHLLDPAFGDFTPYTTLYPGIAFLALYVGLGPSLLAVIFGFVGAVYWFVPPRGSLEVAGNVHVAGAWTFLIVCGCIIAVGEVSRRSRTRMRRTQGLLEAFLDKRKRTEEELRAASAQLRGFLETVPTGLTRCSRDLRYLAANAAYAEMLGLPAEQIVGRPIVDVMGTEAWEKIRPYVERVLSGERVEYETLLPLRAGGSRYVQVVYTPERDSAGNVAGWVASVTDITEMKRVEGKLRKAEKLATAGQLAATLAHEINNPLSSVTNALYLLMSRSDLDAAAGNLARTAASEVARVSRIVKQSLSYYRTATVPQPLDLGAIVEESLQIFSGKFQRSGIQLRKRITPETSITGFPDEIRQVIDNLLLNALEATPKGGRMTVSVRWSRNWKNRKEGVRLTIGDSGHGIAKEQLARIFEPFFTTKAERGTGLGLWVVSGVVAKHDGDIRVRSAETQGKSGTVVSILWPSSSRNHRKRKLARSESAA